MTLEAMSSARRCLALRPAEIRAISCCWAGAGPGLRRVPACPVHPVRRGGCGPAGAVDGAPGQADGVLGHGRDEGPDGDDDEGPDGDDDGDPGGDDDEGPGGDDDGDPGGDDDGDPDGG